MRAGACCHSGVRASPRRRGKSSARAAFHGRWAANIAEPPSFLDHQVFDGIGIGKQQIDDRAILQPLGQAQRDAVVGPDGVQVRPEAARGRRRQSPVPTARALARRMASARTPANRPARRGSARRITVRSLGTAPVISFCSAR